MVTKLINGQYVNLISWQPPGSKNGSGNVTLANWQDKIPIYSLGIGGTSPASTSMPPSRPRPR